MKIAKRIPCIAVSVALLASVVLLGVCEEKKDLPSYKVTAVIDNGDPETSFTVDWTVSGGENPYGADSLYNKVAGSTYTDFDNIMANSARIERCTIIWALPTAGYLSIRRRPIRPPYQFGERRVRPRRRSRDADTKAPK